MSLMDMFSNFGNDPWANLSSAMFGTGGNSGGGIVPAIGGLIGGAQSLQNNSNINNQVQGNLGGQTSALQQQLATLQQQQAQQAQQAQEQYQAGLANVNSQNSQLQGQIDNQTANLAALSDPNSAYMQQARQAIERKDAAAGRNSQWGDRETQLAAALAGQVAQYSPGMNQAITQARNQISSNNGSLANLYQTAYGPANTSSAQQIAALQQQIAAANAQNTTGRQAANAQSNSIGNMITSGGKLLGGLGSLFGGSSGGGNSILDYFGNQGSVNSGITGYGNGIGDWYGGTNGLTGSGISPGSIYDNQQYGYGSLPAGDYLGGGGFGGTPMSFDNIDW